MHAVYKINRPKEKLPMQQVVKCTDTTSFRTQVGLNPNNQYSASPCPKGSGRARAYSKGKFIPK